jgi:hypothetical protein
VNQAYFDTVAQRRVHRDRRRSAAYHGHLRRVEARA